MVREGSRQQKGGAGRGWCVKDQGIRSQGVEGPARRTRRSWKRLTDMILVVVLVDLVAPTKHGRRHGTAREQGRQRRQIHAKPCSAALWLYTVPYSTVQYPRYPPPHGPLPARRACPALPPCRQSRRPRRCPLPPPWACLGSAISAAAPAASPSRFPSRCAPPVYPAWAAGGKAVRCRWRLPLRRHERRQRRWRPPRQQRLCRAPRLTLSGRRRARRMSCLRCGRAPCSSPCGARGHVGR